MCCEDDGKPAVVLGLVSGEGQGVDYIVNVRAAIHR